MKELKIVLIALACLTGVGLVMYYRKNTDEATLATAQINSISFASRTDIENGLTDGLAVKSKDLHNVLYDLRIQLQNSASNAMSSRYPKSFTNEIAVVVTLSEHQKANPIVIVRDATGLKIAHDDQVDANGDVTVTFTEATTGTIYIS